MTWILAVWALGIGLFDLRTSRIPNAALILLLVPALLALAVNRQGLLGAEVLSSLGGFLVGGLLMLPGYRLGKMGAGDVKFAACIGLLLGFWHSIEWVLVSLIAIGLVSAVWIAIKQRWESLHDRLPAGFAMSLVFCAEMAFGPLLKAFKG